MAIRGFVDGELGERNWRAHLQGGRGNQPHCRERSRACRITTARSRSTATSHSIDPAGDLSSGYTQTFGNPDMQVSHRVYAGFLQDRWRVGGATLEAGARWDYDDAPGASRDMANVAPRLSVAFDPARTGRTVFQRRLRPLLRSDSALGCDCGTPGLVIRPDLRSYPDYRSHTNPNGRIEAPTEYLEASRPERSC